jgi:hypothetical protein
MYIICLNNFKSFKKYKTYIWYSFDFIEMDIKYYFIKNNSGELVGYLNEGQIKSNFTTMYYWNKADRECSKIFHDLMDGKCDL